ncbi:hypothetical protein GUU_02072 [Malacoplasma iowae 695]|nr:hypothetical protein GUU_02072 [Malacoplasma iowae 695]
MNSIVINLAHFERAIKGKANRPDNPIFCNVSQTHPP